MLAAGPLPPSNAPWVVEVGGWIAFGLVAVFLLYRWRKNGRPDTAALLFIGCFTMWWQEFYADWGAYLYYNPDLARLPWGKTPYTTPNKPVYVLAGYGWFYAGGFAAVLALFRWFRRRYASVNYVAALVIAVFVPFMLWNFVTADGVSYVTNWFQYLESIGPTIHTDKGGLQLIYQGVPLGHLRRRRGRQPRPARRRRAHLVRTGAWRATGHHQLWTAGTPDRRLDRRDERPLCGVPDPAAGDRAHPVLP